MASTDDITGIRSEIRGSGPTGRGGDQPYIDPSMFPGEMDKESFDRTVHKGGVAASKFFGIFGAIAGALGGGGARLIFKEHITSGWMATGIGAAVTGLFGAFAGYFLGKSAVTSHINETNARMKAFLESQALTQPPAGDVPLPPMPRVKETSGEALPNVLTANENSVSPPPGKEIGVSPEPTPPALTKEPAPKPGTAKDEVSPDTALKQVALSELAGRVNNQEQTLQQG